MKENVKRVFDKIEPQGSDAAFIGSVIRRADRRKKAVKIGGAAAAVFAVAVAAGAIGAVHAYFEMRNEVYVPPETAVTENNELTPQEIFAKCGIANAEALTIAIKPDYTVLENTFEGINFEAAAIADDLRGGVLIAFRLTSKDGFPFDNEGLYCFGRDNTQINGINGKSPVAETLIIRGENKGQAYVAVMLSDKSVIENQTLVFEQNGIYEMGPPDQEPQSLFKSGHLKIEIDRNDIPMCPVFRAENADITVTPLGVYSAESITGAEIYTEDGKSVSYDLAAVSNNFYIPSFIAIDIDGIGGFSVKYYGENETYEYHPDYYTTVIADDNGSVISS